MVSLSAAVRSTPWRIRPAHVREGSGGQPGGDRDPRLPDSARARHRHGRGLLGGRPGGAARRLRDEAFLLGPTPASESYLAIDRILDAAQRAGAQAVHPGYGFLAENAAFARAVEGAGLVWIGPPPAAIELMGSKTAARTAMQEAGVPIIPGTTDPVGSVDELLGLGEQIGYPLLIKAAAGGGGKGMEVVDA